LTVYSTPGVRVPGGRVTTVEEGGAVKVRVCCCPTFGVVVVVVVAVPGVEEGTTAAIGKPVSVRRMLV